MSCTPNHPLNAGDIVGRYRIESLLGSGGMGNVYLALDPQLRRRVALKFVNPARQSSHELVREARFAASLKHPSICTIHGLDYLGVEPFLVMEYIKGVSLSKVIRGRRLLSMATALGFAHQIIEAVAHAHQQGVVHGDLKSSNIMVGSRGHITILDFGLAVRRRVEAGADDTESAGVSPSSGATGTVPYMAPEIIRGAQPAVASDIWALGVLLFELAAGRRPFGGMTSYEVASNILTDQRTPMASVIEKPLSAVINGCLRSSPAERYESAQSLAAALQLLPARLRRRLEKPPAVAVQSPACHSL